MTWKTCKNKEPKRRSLLQLRDVCSAIATFQSIFVDRFTFSHVFRTSKTTRASSSDQRKTEKEMLIYKYKRNNQRAVARARLHFCRSTKKKSKQIQRKKSKRKCREWTRTLVAYRQRTKRKTSCHDYSLIVFISFQSLFICVDSFKFSSSVCLCLCRFSIISRFVVFFIIIILHLNNKQTTGRESDRERRRNYN